MAADTCIMERPAIGEYDVQSYLDASINAHDVLGGDELSGLNLDGCPSYEHEAFNDAPELCREHAEELARTVGFTGPVTLPTSYQPGMQFEPERVMVRRVDGLVVQIATYSYGRACFEPGEPRTKPCAVCGVETLRDAFVK